MRDVIRVNIIVEGYTEVVMRRECSHFNQWLLRLEELAIYKRG
ncbi:MAG: hypothetical protein QG666_702 [Euryarchaeota archaeon]|nr:hypothetical protein [Euryarchaeota archaeon]